MASAASENSPSLAGRAVFLSYAREDDAAARRIADALRGFGVEAWFDQSELRGGDAWDQKIRRQIKDCTLFIPIISSHTQARGEGYFRLEWKLAAERTHLMAEGVPFLAPVVVDDTPDSAAAVPPEFLRVQWTRLPGGAPTPEFVAQVKRLLAAPKTAFDVGRGLPTPPVRLARTDAAGSGDPALQRKSFAPTWTLGAIVAVVMGIGTALYVSLRPSSRTVLPKPVAETKSVSASPAPDLSAVASAKADPKSIAVLAFANLSADKDNEYFSDGLSENILDKLARVPGLRVMARTSSFSYKGKNATAQQIGQELRVGTVIEGSVMRAGNQLRITAQLINAADGTHVWSEQFDRELTTSGLFAMQDEIALKIAARLAPSAAVSNATEERPTKNLEAYEAYLRGRDLQWRSSSSRGRAEAAQFYRRATELDPTFALAWARLGQSLAWVYWVGGINEDEDIEPARRAVEEAERFQPDLPETHLARAMLLRSEGLNLAPALREVELAEKSRAGSAEIFGQRGNILRYLNRLDEGIVTLQKAVALDPLNASALNDLAITFYVVGRYDESLATYERGQVVGTGVLPFINAASLLCYKLGNPAAAARAIATIPPSVSDSWSRARAARILFVAGDGAAALAEIGRIEKVSNLNQWGYQVRDLEAAQLEELMGDPGSAQKHYAAALMLAENFRARHPQAWRAYPTLARAYAGLGRRDEAIAAARKGFDLLPVKENPWIASDTTAAVMVEVLSRFGLMDEALKLAREQVATGYWRKNDLRYRLEFSFARKDARFRDLAEKAPL